MGTGVQVNTERDYLYLIKQIYLQAGEKSTGFPLPSSGSPAVSPRVCSPNDAPVKVAKRPR